MNLKTNGYLLFIFNLAIYFARAHIDYNGGLIP